MNVQFSSFIHRGALHAQLQMDCFRFVNYRYQKFVTKRVILRIEVQGGEKGSFKAVLRWYHLHAHRNYPYSGCHAEIGNFNPEIFYVPHIAPK